VSSEDKEHASMSQVDRPHPSSRLRGHKSFGRVARASTMWAYLRAGAQALIAIPATVILARTLTPEEFGIAAAAMFFSQLASRLSSGGMGNALVRVKELRPEHISTVFTFNAAVSVVSVACLLAAAPFIGRFYGRPEIAALLPIVAIDFALGALTNVQQALLSRDLRYREMAKIGTADVTTSAILSVVLALSGFRYWSLVLAEVAGAFVKFMYGVRVAGWHVRLHFDRDAFRDLRSFAAGSFARRLLEHLTRNTDDLVVGRTLGMSALGFYDKAFSLANRLYLRMTVVGPGVSFRIFSIIQDEPERFRRGYRKVIMTATLLSYTVFAAMAAMAPHLVVIAFGERWRPSTVPFQLLCVSFSLKLLNQYATAASQAHGWIWPQVWRQAVQVVCIVVGVYLATPWGINGAALAVLGASLVMFFLTQGMMRAATGLGWADILRPQIPAMTLVALLFLPLLGLDALLDRVGAGAPVILGAQAATAAVIVLAFAWWCPYRDARVLMYDAVHDVWPRLADWLWSDIASDQAGERKRRRAVAATPEIDAETHVAS
jgi:teichuronic acid exporter